MGDYTLSQASSEYRCKYGSTPKLSKTNYFTWRPDMETFLGSEEALGIVLGNEDRPVAGRVNASRDYNLRSARAITLIFNSCTQGIKTYIKGIQDPQVMWNTLAEKLNTANSRAGRTAVAMRFSNLRPVTDDINEYITAVLDCRNELAGTDKEISDEAVNTKLTTTVPAVFRPVLDIIARQPIEIQTLDYLVNSLLEYEQEIVNRVKVSGIDIDNPIPARDTLPQIPIQASPAFHYAKYTSGEQAHPAGSSFRSHSQRFQQLTPTTTPSRTTCWYCRKIGHRERDCRKRASDMRHQRGSSGHRRRGRGGRGGQGEGRFGTGKRGDYRGNAHVQDRQNTSGSYGDGSGGSFANLEEGRIDAGFVRALVAIEGGSMRDNLDDLWVVDSGASKHLCHKRTRFQSIEKLRVPVQIVTADNTTLWASEIGFVQLYPTSNTKDYLTIEALYVPNLSHSLLSVSCLSARFAITFVNGLCYLGSECIGYQQGGVYFLTSSPPLSMLPQGPAITTHQSHCGFKAITLDILLWHRRLGHLGITSLKQLLPPKDFTNPATILAIEDCAVCIKAKQQRKIIRQPVLRTQRPFELIHSDLCGPILPVSPTGARYFILYIDDFSRTAFLHFLYSKNSSEITAVFQAFRERISNQFPQFRMSRFRCDNGKGEYDNAFFRGILKTYGIAFEPSPPHTQHKNGTSERMIRTLVTKARALLLDSRLPDELWAEAVHTANYLHTRSPSRSIGGKTPYELLYGTTPDLSHLRRFGCIAYKLLPKEQRLGKFGARARPCAFVGYVHNTQKIWRIWDPVIGKTVQASDIRFDESEFLNVVKGDAPESTVLRALIPDSMPDEPDAMEYTDTEYPGHIDYQRGGILEGPSQTQNIQQVINPSAIMSMEEEAAIKVLPELPALQAPASSHMKHHRTVAPLRRSTRERKRPARAAAAIAVQVGGTVTESQDAHLEEDPSSYREASTHIHALEWECAIQAEFKSLEENDTWEYEQVDSAAGRKPIGCKWVFRTKVNYDGSKRYKARLVIKGYEQVPGIDFGDTFAPVAKLVSFRMLMALSALYGWHVHHMDVVTAFLNPAIDEPVSMELPEGIEWLKPTLRKPSTIQCRLKKALYGLKQAPRLWFQHIDSFLRANGFRQSGNEPTLYILWESHTKESPILKSSSGSLFLLLYVDDLLIASLNSGLIKQVKELLSTAYRMTDLGLARQFLNIKIERYSTMNKEDSSSHTHAKLVYHVRLSQERFIDELLKRFHMVECNGTKTPLETGHDLRVQVPTISTESHLETSSQPINSTTLILKEYQSLVGSLMYLMLSTRPDLAFTISTLSKFASAPLPIHLAAAKRVLRYLKATKTLALSFSSELRDAQLVGFSDSDWGGDRDDRKSTAGYVFTIGGTAISWKSKKQPVVALSSTEAEYIGTSEATREAIWLQRLLHELTQSDKPTNPQLLFVDNQGAIKLTENPRFHERTKHIDIKYHFVRQACENGLITVQYISTSKMTADIMTKALPTERHWIHLAGMGLSFEIV